MPKTSILIVLAVVFIMVNIKPASANLIQNPSFEVWTNPQTPVSWTVEDTVYAKIYKESTRVFHGVYAAKLQRLQAGTGNSKGLLQRVAVPGRGQYVASMRVYHNPDSVRCGLTITWRNATEGFISSWSTVYAESIAPIWQAVRKAAITDTAPNGAAYADFIIRTYGRSTPTPSPSGGTFVVDSVIFYNATAIKETQSNDIKNRLHLEINPNPFRNTVRINFSTNPADFSAIKIYDAAGQVVRIIRSTVEDNGLQVANWDGRNENSLRSAPGIYFVVLETLNAQTKTVKTLYLR